MASIDYTLVLGVDARHLKQLSWTIKTWKKHKPSLWDAPWCVFYDHEEVTDSQVTEVLGRDALLVAWPPPRVMYGGDPEGPKQQLPQRYKMLAGFLHVPAMAVHTSYWLKLDTDVVATGVDDWIRGEWFDNSPAIVSHRWSFTKPANQMQLLDEWVANNPDALEVLDHNPPLNLEPQPGAERLGHRRIISWCGFFDTIVTRFAADCADQTVGHYQMPTPSQDGYAWYVASRLKLPIRRTNMKQQGWQQWSTDNNIRHAVEEIVGCGN